MKNILFQKQNKPAFHLWRVLGGVLLSTTLLFGQEKNPVVLIEKGQATACIYIGKEGSSTEEYAAEELVNALQKMSGVKISIIRDVSEIKSAYRVVIGTPRTNPLAAEVWPELKLDPKGAGRDRLIIKTMGNTLYLCGDEPAGALYATYCFLEQLGVRWLWPGETGEFIPKKEKVEVQETNIVQTPSFKKRGYGLAGNWWPPESEVWMARNRMNYKFTIGDIGETDERSVNKNKELIKRAKKMGALIIYYNHNFSDAIPGNEFYTHPEYSALIDGKRAIGAQHCWSNPEVQKRYAEWIDATWQNYPELEQMALFPLDNSANCRCENCAKMDDPEEAKQGNISTRFQRFLKAVFTRVKTKRPMSDYIFAAYQTYKRPSYREKMIPGMEVMYCTYERCVIHTLDDDCPVNHLLQTNLNEWVALGNPMSTYDYFLLADDPPLAPIDYVIADELRYIHRLGFTGFFPEGNGFGWAQNRGLPPEKDPWTVNRLAFYIGARFMWDVNLDMKAVVHDYMKTAYGPAGEQMEELYNVFRKSLEKSPFHVAQSWHPAARQQCAKDYVTPVISSQARARLRKAGESAAGIEGVRGEQIRQDVSFHKDLLKKWEAFRPTYHKIWVDVPFSETEPVLDGKGDDVCWKNAAVLGDFAAKGTAGKERIEDQTEAYLLWTKDSLWIKVVCYEHNIPGMAKKSTARDFNIAEDDVLQILIDPFLTREKYLHFAVNPIAARYDSQKTAGQPPDVSWNGEWPARTSVNSNSWTAELKIPFAGIGVGAPKPGEHWLFTVNRACAGRKGYADSGWTDGSKSLDNFGTLTFKKQVSGKQ